MSLNWRWEEKCGELTFSQNYRGYKEYTVSLYQGNACLIFLDEFKDEETGKDMYNMWNFWVDKDHMRRCLGLVKGHDNLYNYEGCKFEKIRLNKAKNRYWKDIVKALTEAFDDITIELYSE